MIADVLGGGAAALMTVMILSYLVGDNPIFRIAVNIFVGVAAGYVAAVAWWQVLLPRLILPLTSASPSDRAMLAVPLLLSGMLLMKAWPPLSKLGEPALGLLVGVAASVAIAGAVRGTLLPQLSATLDDFTASRIASVDGLLNAGLVLLGLLTSLIYFQFSAGVRKDGSTGRSRLIEFIAILGGAFIAITLGVVFAGVYSASLTALIERLHFLGSLIGLG
jgi:hypothetical protein